ncbi:MAG: response regulator [Acidobacteriota bacterium]|nr:response regulator [Acidobacteriota bacterium]MDH3785085.1 response regulator [Acidobacteriota bacterium]
MSKRDRLLVVDDDHSMRAVLEQRFLDAGYEVHLAKDGREGLQRTRELLPQFVLCDWVMPNLDGIQYCRSIKSDPGLRETYVVLLSARDSAEDQVMGLDSGADDYLAKPFDPPELLARVRVGIRARRLNDELRKTEHQTALLEMAATLGHEINNPLTALFGHMELLSQYLDQKNEARSSHHLKEAGLVATRMADVAQRLIRLQDPRTTHYLEDLRMLDLD